MSEEKNLIEPELELTAIVYLYNGRPCLNLTKHIESKEKIQLLSGLILEDGYIPCRIMVKDKLKFFSKLKALKLI